ncbi:MAG: hypothetical protein KC912_14745 [Proteobacteria bacterium]|nr:hypothetical protein [Pseudomonadota bacterium]
MRWLLPLICLAACEPVERAPCQVRGDAELELTPSDRSFGEFTSGDDIVFGPPPQGGAPYAALTGRVDGLDLVDGVTLELWGEDVESGEDLGSLSYETRLVCANVGDSAGNWLATDVHFRFFGWNLDQLGGRVAELSMRVTDKDGMSVEQSVVGELVEDMD